MEVLVLSCCGLQCQGFVSARSNPEKVFNVGII